MNWIILIVAGLFETGFAFCLGKMKEATGAEYCWWGTGFLLSLALSMTLLAKATQSLPIGTAYPVWTGIGAVGTVLAGILFLNEPATFPRIFFLLLLIGAAGTTWNRPVGKGRPVPLCSAIAAALAAGNGIWADWLCAPHRPNGGWRRPATAGRPCV